MRLKSPGFIFSSPPTANRGARGPGLGLCCDDPCVNPGVFFCVCVFWLMLLPRITGWEKERFPLRWGWLGWLVDRKGGIKNTWGWLEVATCGMRSWMIFFFLRAFTRARPVSDWPLQEPSFTYLHR